MKHKINLPDNVRIVVIMALCIIGGSTVVIMFRIFGVCLSIVDSITMVSTLFAAIFFGYYQIIRRPKIVVSEKETIEYCSNYQNKNNGYYKYYYVVANVGNLMIQKIDIKGDVAKINLINFLAPNEKAPIEINKQFCVEELSDEEAIARGVCKTSKPYQPNVGISKDQETIYVCTNSYRKNNAGKLRQIQWIYNANEPIFAPFDWEEALKHTNTSCTATDKDRKDIEND